MPSGFYGLNGERGSRRLVERSKHTRCRSGLGTITCSLYILAVKDSRCDMKMSMFTCKSKSFGAQHTSAWGTADFHCDPAKRLDYTSSPLLAYDAFTPNACTCPSLPANAPHRSIAPSDDRPPSFDAMRSYLPSARATNTRQLRHQLQ